MVTTEVTCPKCDSSNREEIDEKYRFCKDCGTKYNRNLLLTRMRLMQTMMAVDDKEDGMSAEHGVILLGGILLSILKDDDTFETFLQLTGDTDIDKDE